jgi:transcription initiation factor TFIID subunit 11
MSLTSGVSAPLKKKPRKRKSKTAGNDDESLVGGKARSERSGRSGKSGRSAVKTSARDPSVDEDEEEGGENTAVAMVKSTEEEKKKEKEQRAMLLGAFDAEQFHRYEAWRSTKLGDAVVRRVCLLSFIDVVKGLP